MSKHVIHQHSSVADKRPSASSLEVNYASGKEAVMLKNTEDAVVTISSDSQNDSKFATKTDISGLSSQITDIEQNITTISGQIESIGECSHVGEVYPGSTSGEVFNNYTSNIASGDYSHAEGTSTSATGRYAHAEGFRCVASGSAAHAEGEMTSATGMYAHAEGYLSKASAVYSHAEGRGCVASGTAAHAEGEMTSATTAHSHAEGYLSKASAMEAHAEGYNCVAAGNDSHAEGYCTIANNNHEHACGRYNKSDNISTTSRQTRFSIGIGTSNTARKNAIEAKSNGDVYIYGVGGFDGQNDADADVLPIGEAFPSIVVTSALPSTLASDTIYFIY